MNTINRITIRLNKVELNSFKLLVKTYKIKSKSGFIKDLIFRDIKPFISLEEKELVRALIIELNAIGRNLNQLLKYKAVEEAHLIVKEIKLKINELQKIL